MACRWWKPTTPNDRYSWATTPIGCCWWYAIHTMPSICIGTSAVPTTTQSVWWKVSMSHLGMFGKDWWWMTWTCFASFISGGWPNTFKTCFDCIVCNWRTNASLHSRISIKLVGTLLNVKSLTHIYNNQNEEEEQEMPLNSTNNHRYISKTSPYTSTIHKRHELCQFYDGDQCLDEGCIRCIACADTFPPSPTNFRESSTPTNAPLSTYMSEDTVIGSQSKTTSECPPPCMNVYE